MASTNVSGSGNSGSSGVEATSASASSSDATSSSSNITSAASASSSGYDAVGSAGDLCSWYEDQACLVPRGCSDCLDTRLPSGDSCALDSTLGLCVSTSSISTSALDNATARYFTAAAYSYCSAEDAACAACRSDWLQQFQAVGYVRASDAVCVGEGGCVCMAACANPQWASAVLTDQCGLLGGAFSRIVAGVGVSGCIVVLLLFICACLRKWTSEHDHPTVETVVRRIRFGLSGQEEDGGERRRRETELDMFYFRRFGRRRQHQSSENNAARGGGRTLTLPAWSSMREALIESEKQSDQQTKTPVRLVRAPSIVAADEQV